MGGCGEFVEAGRVEGFVGLPVDVAGAVDEEDVAGVRSGEGEVGGLLPGGFVGGEREEVGLEGVGDLLADVVEDGGADEGRGVLEEGDVVVVDGRGSGDGGGAGARGADGRFPGGGGVGGGVGEAEDEDRGGGGEVAGEGDGVAVECGAGGGGDGEE